MVFPFPEQGVGLQAIHEIISGLECFTPMNGRNGHKDDSGLWGNRSAPVNDAHMADREALRTVVRNALERVNGQTGMMFEHQPLNRQTVLPD